MASQSSAVGRAQARRMTAAATDELVLAAAAHLTSRDRQLVRAVGEHRVLTTGQLAALGFGSVITARHRLAVLVQIGVLRRFRPHRETGSAPWHYLLGPVGVVLLGAEDADEKRWLAAVRTDRQLALGRSQRLAHLVGVNWFFAALAAGARGAGPGAELPRWLNEAATAGWLQGRAAARLAWEGPPRPDALGCWAEHGQQVMFLMEYDTGSEHLPQLAGKLASYSRLARAMADVEQLCPALLFCFAGPRREQAARHALASAGEAAALRIATTGLDPEHASPAEPVWLPLLPGWAGGRVALCALAARSSSPNRPAIAARPSASSTAAAPVMAASSTARAIFDRTRWAPDAAASVSHRAAPSPRPRNASSAAVLARGRGCRGPFPAGWPG